MDATRARRIRWARRATGVVLLVLACEALLYQRPQYQTVVQVRGWSIWVFEGAEGVRIEEQGFRGVPRARDGESEPFLIRAYLNTRPVRTIAGLLPVEAPGLYLGERGLSSPLQPNLTRLDAAGEESVRRQLAEMVAQQGRPRWRLEKRWWEGPRERINWNKAMSDNVRLFSIPFGAAGLVVLFLWTPWERRVSREMEARMLRAVPL
jgi:hypothetical protein